MIETNIHVRSFDADITPEEFSKIERHPITVVLDNLRSAFNVGSIFRTADCALIKEVITCGCTAYPPHDKLTKTSLGAINYVPSRHFENTIDAANEFKSNKIPIIALELTNKSKILWEFDFPLPVAIVLGNEALGVDPAILKMADHIIEIPMQGFKNSMNVGCTFATVVYEIHRQYWNRKNHRKRINLAINATTSSDRYF
ncbi:RNA methyltransferase [bacterium]|nr:RNA methyltransferase [bacterium]